MAQLKRALGSESEESPATLPVSPIKKRPRTDIGTPARCPVAPEKQTKLVLSTPEKMARAESPAPADIAALLPVAIKREGWPGLARFDNWIVFGDSFSAENDKVWHRYLREKLDEISAAAAVKNYATEGASVEDDVPDQVADNFCIEHAENPLDPVRTLYIFWLGLYDCWFFDEDKTEYSGTQDKSEDDESNHESGDAKEEAPKISPQVIRLIESELERRKKQATESIDEEPEVESLTTVVSMLFDSIHHVYEASARNFLIIDVPPGDRAPSVDARLAHDLQRRITVWNEALRTAAEEFATKHLDASVFVFSSHKVFSDLLDDPEKFGFDDDDDDDNDDDNDDELEANGKIWTSETDVNVSVKVHHLLAEKVADAISFVENGED